MTKYEFLVIYCWSDKGETGFGQHAISSTSEILFESHEDVTRAMELIREKYSSHTVIVILNCIRIGSPFASLRENNK